MFLARALVVVIHFDALMHTRLLLIMVSKADESMKLRLGAGKILLSSMTNFSTIVLAK